MGAAAEVRADPILLIHFFLLCIISARFCPLVRKIRNYLPFFVSLTDLQQAADRPGSFVWLKAPFLPIKFWPIGATVEREIAELVKEGRGVGRFSSFNPEHCIRCG